MAQLALKYADHAQKVWPAERLAIGGGSYAVPRTYVALARYAPDKVLQIPENSQRAASSFSIAPMRGGEAFLLKGDAAGARAELKALGKVKGGGGTPELVIAQERARRPYRHGGRQSRQSREAVRGRRQGAGGKARRQLDPPGWWYPVRRSAAAAYLKAGDYAKAQAEAEKSLTGWKHDPLALWVKAKAQASLGKTADSEATNAEARKLWHGDFDSITADAV